MKPELAFPHNYFHHCRALHREIGMDDACSVITALFNSNYFFVLAFVAFVACAGMGLFALCCEQLYNMATNMVSMCIVYWSAN